MVTSICKSIDTSYRENQLVDRDIAIPAGTVLVLASASHMAAVGTAEYAADFVRASIRLRETLAGGVRVLHGIPLLIGGTSNTAAIRTMEEINQWITNISGVQQDISSTRALWATLISNRSNCTESMHTLRLPLSMLKLEMGTFIGGGYID
jgi:hypothetical protein